MKKEGFNENVFLSEQESAENDASKDPIADDFSSLESLVHRFVEDAKADSSPLKYSKEESKEIQREIYAKWPLFESMVKEKETALYAIQCLNQLAYVPEFHKVALGTLEKHTKEIDEYITKPEAVFGDSDSIRITTLEALVAIARSSKKKNIVKQAKFLLGSHFPFVMDAIERENGGEQYIDTLCDIMTSLDDKDFAAAKEWFATFLDREEYAEVEPGTIVARFVSHSSFNQGRNRVQGLARASEFSRVVFNKYGWSEDKYTQDWKNNSEDYDDYLQIFARNLKAMLNLERLQPEAVETLRREFSITNFGRYPLEMLDRQCQKKDEPAPYGIIVMPKDDHNGVFYQQAEVFAEFDESLKNKFLVRIIECGTKWDIGRMLLTLNKRYGANNKISFAILGGHGNEETVVMGDSRKKGMAGKDRDEIVISDLMELESGSGRTVLERISDFFKRDAVIVIDACCSGAKGGIGQKLSETLGREVIGPDASAALVKLKAVVGKNNKGSPKISATFDVGAHTMAYKKGKPIVSSSAR